MKIRELYKAVAKKLNFGGIESAETEARFMLYDALKLTASDFYMKSDCEVDTQSIEKLDKMCTRRLGGEPLQYILGRWDFMGESYRVGKGVLIPRPETEQLCELIINKLKNKKHAVVYDLCAGSGCIGLTLKKECPDIDLYLVEKSGDALKYLMDNAAEVCKNTFLTIVKGDVLQLDLFELYPPADVIVSNPPYIKSDEVPLLQKEVTFEPTMALDGGEDGLVFYRYIISQWSHKLKDDGEMFFEIGEEQGSEVSSLFKNIGFDSRVIKDYNNHDRIVTGRKMPYDI